MAGCLCLASSGGGGSGGGGLGVVGGREGRREASAHLKDSESTKGDHGMGRISGRWKFPKKKCKFYKKTRLARYYLKNMLFFVCVLLKLPKIIEPNAFFCINF